jgi:hypothetical protein
MWGALSDERMILPFTIAAGPRRRSHSWVQSHGIRDHCQSQSQRHCHVFYLHVATINVDSPDLTRKFIGTIVEITHNRYNTQFRV